MLLSQTLLAQNSVEKTYNSAPWERFFTDRTDKFMDAWVAKGLLDKQGGHYYMTFPAKKVWNTTQLQWHQLYTKPDTMMFLGGSDWFAFENNLSIDPDTLYYYEIEFSKPSKVLKVEVKKKKEDENKPKTGNHFGWYLPKLIKEAKLKEKKEKDKIKIKKVK